MSRPSMLGHASRFVALCCCLAMVSCSGETPEPEPDTQGTPAPEQVLTEEQQLAEHVASARAMEVVDWHAEMYDDHPSADGELVVELDGTYFSGNGDGRVKAQISGDGVTTALSYVMASERIFFHTDAWGTRLEGCWVDATDQPELLRILPEEPDPRWVLGRIRPIRIRGDGLEAAARADVIAAAIPRHAYLRIPRSVRDIDVDVDVASAGDGLHLEVDAAQIWMALVDADVPAEQLSTAGSWWTLDLKPAKDVSPVRAPAPDALVAPGAVGPDTSCVSGTS